MEAVFRNLYLNQRVETSNKFVSTEAYNACVGELPDLTGRPCWAGLDLASVKDLSGFVLCFEPLEGEPYFVVPFSWCPSDSIEERTKKDRQPYSLWQRQGFIESTPGGVINYTPILAKIDELAKIYDIKGVVFDRWGSQKIIHDLQEMGLDVVEMGQGFASLSAPVRELEKLILERGICFPENPVLKWNFSNLVIEQDAAGNKKFSKGKSSEKIDLCAALVMALDATIRNRQENSEPSLMWL